jgi:hypothetical protein
VAPDQPERPSRWARSRAFVTNCVTNIVGGKCCSHWGAKHVRKTAAGTHTR